MELSHQGDNHGWNYASRQPRWNYVSSDNHKWNYAETGNQGGITSPKRQPRAELRQSGNQGGIKSPKQQPQTELRQNGNPVESCPWQPQNGGIRSSVHRSATTTGYPMGTQGTGSRSHTAPRKEMAGHTQPNGQRCWPRWLPSNLNYLFPRGGIISLRWHVCAQQ